MKTKDDIKGMSIEDLSTEITKSQRDLLEVKMKIEAGQEKDTSKQRKKRREISRMKTVLRQKQTSLSTK